MARREGYNEGWAAARHTYEREEKRYQDRLDDAEERIRRLRMENEDLYRENQRIKSGALDQLKMRLLEEESNMRSHFDEKNQLLDETRVLKTQKELLEGRPDDTVGKIERLVDRFADRAPEIVAAINGNTTTVPTLGEPQLTPVESENGTMSTQAALQKFKMNALERAIQTLTAPIPNYQLFATNWQELCLWLENGGIPDLPHDLVITIAQELAVFALDNAVPADRVAALLLPIFAPHNKLIEYLSDAHPKKATKRLLRTAGIKPDARLLAYVQDVIVALQSKIDIPED